LGITGRALREFLADLRSILGAGALGRTGRKAWEDDCPGLAAQLAYFILLFLFPFLMLLVAAAGLAVDDPESLLETLTERMGGLLPEDAVVLLVDYADRTLRSRTSGVLFFAVLLVLGSGSAASQAIIKAANRAYDVTETRPFFKIWGISILMGLGVTVLVGALAFATFGPEIGGYVRRMTGLPGVFQTFWGALSWAVAFLTVTLSLAVLYYLAPNADVPFKWITPGGFAATALVLASSVVLNLYVSNIGRYDQVYGQLGAVVVLMLWLYVTGLTVLIGVEMNAVLARMAEERKGVELVQTEDEAET
ncbi:MAG: YihY/virulence factor BrkB family protein, partial [Actinobacteria bacterium]|nr:YihY/virulence factor BrkB family protein [Actinomycetota bacterium]